MAEELKQVLKFLADFDENELHEICACFTQKVVKKNTILLSEGQICQEFYYVKRGILRTYFITGHGHEKTRLVNIDSSIGTALASFVTKQPSYEYIDVLEDTELYAISRADFYRFNGELPHWKDFYQKMLEMAYVYQNNYIERLVTLSAKERYDYVLNNQPKMIQRLPNKILASFLDVTQETLSRLKSR